MKLLGGTNAKAFLDAVLLGSPMQKWNEVQFLEVTQEAQKKNGEWAKKGRVADYIPELAKGDGNHLGITLLSKEGEVAVGDVEVPFTLQSISKIVTLMVALRDHGYDRVFSYVGVEPTGDPFNSIVKLETLEERPLNPMINAGAIAVCSLIQGSTVEERLDRILHLVSEIVGRNVGINTAVYASERDTGHRNRSLAYFMKDTKILQGDVEEVLELYFRQCAIEVDCRELARLGLFLADKGREKLGKSLISEDIIRVVTTFMVTCGMYNASGEFAIEVGIPAKSGVSGGIVACVPGQLGIGVFAPALDAKGNSLAGVRCLKDLSRGLDLSIF